KNAAGVEISHFDVPANTTSPATPIPVGTRSICVSLTIALAAMDCLNAAPGGVHIPTLSEWAMIIFSVLLLGMMTYYVVRRRRTAQSVAI
ncbi:MAG: IPTL-CTERM sorting domain-containing protein, partial [Candidatus Zixiibacteriota bacterium]